ncbi:MAG: sigma-70 family RNA polymerase sigma factor [Alphaproteobacteria bacterium]|nr:sigma-70 family RNA polymerase sigma factor [Alphaproteobacteria bacterium]MCB9744050.1 sigma-70 family RNA polymerase sigma factor [Alphaproteobacteria bacterium]MCB9792972.1 sigma-70 family RNA polymerase sigma factor [Alphaproteobacteria bacterium]
MAQPVPRPDPRLARAAAGDRAARAEILAEHGPRVWGLCRRLSPHPEDCYQEIWARIFDRLHRFDPDGAASLGTWIGTLAHRALIDRHRRRRARGEALPLGERAAEGPGVEELLHAHGRAARLERALQGLPEGQRRVLVLHHIEGLGLSEIAEAEGVAVGTIKSRLHRGRARLARALVGGAP